MQEKAWIKFGLNKTKLEKAMFDLEIPIAQCLFTLIEFSLEFVVLTAGMVGLDKILLFLVKEPVLCGIFMNRVSLREACEKA